MKITFHGHSCFEIENGTHRLIIDPFLTGNPVAKTKAEDVKVDYILLTHGHGDHVGDTIQIAKQNNATVIAPYECASWLGWQGVHTHGLAIGGGYNFDFGRIQQTPALHGSGFTIDEKKEIVYLGEAAGLLLTLEDRRIYHAGDTALFSDMKLIGRKPIDLALLPIGDNFTMGPEDALQAAEWVNAKHVIPMHYNTFPLIEQDGKQFKAECEQKGILCTLLNAGESILLYDI